jgi:LuxR family transcriptional regulator, activator of tox operons
MLDDLAPLLSALGTDGFGPVLMDLLHLHCGADLCSVFTLTNDKPGVLVAESSDPASSAFARVASLRYAQRYWRRDVAALSTLGRAHRTVQILKRPARGIRDVEYQHECYTEGSVTERVSLYRLGSPSIIANVYRERASGPFQPQHIEAFAALAQVLHAALVHHARLLMMVQPVPDPAGLLHRLTQRTDLSPREAQVTALIVTGLDQAQIADRLGLRPSSVITYRARAYQKLGVTGRAQLGARLSTLSG